MKIYTICCVPAQIPYLGKLIPEISAKMFSPDWPNPFLIVHIQISFDPLLIHLNLYQQAKNQAISMICSGDSHETSKLTASQECINGLN